jgi:hypothetical protein
MFAKLLAVYEISIRSGAKIKEQSELTGLRIGTSAVFREAVTLGFPLEG